MAGIDEGRLCSDVDKEPGQSFTMAKALFRFETNMQSRSTWVRKESGVQGSVLPTARFDGRWRSQEVE